MSSIGEIMSALRRIGLILRALVASFIFVPIATVLFLHAYHVSPMVSVGFLILEGDVLQIGARFYAANMLYHIQNGSVPKLAGNLTDLLRSFGPTRHRPLCAGH